MIVNVLGTLLFAAFSEGERVPSLTHRFARKVLTEVAAPDATETALSAELPVVCPYKELKVAFSTPVPHRRM